MNGNFDRADVQQLAYEALIQAIDRFDPDRGVPFEAFARIRINGQISNGLAQSSEATAQASYRQRSERERLRSIKQDMPGDAGEDPLAALSLLSATIALSLILDEDVSRKVEEIPDSAPSAYETIAWEELVRTVHALVDTLPEREAYVISQHYRNGVNFQEIASLLGLTKGRVSQIHKAALERLRGLLSKFR